MIKIYNRSTKEYYDVEEPRSLRFLYNTIFGRLILKIVTNQKISKINGKILSSNISKNFIPNFIKKNRIDMSEYPKQRYSSFNDFFCRKIIKGKRPFSNKKSDLIAPADSSLTVYKIDSACSLKVKESIYTINELIQNEKLADRYQNGYCLVFRLGVNDYHHYIYIDEGELLESHKIKGLLHTVNPIAYKRYRVFKENNREWSLLKTANFGEIIQVEVGALNVGKIINSNKTKFNKGQEKGHFEFGASTIILLIADKKISIDQDILDNSQQNIETIVKSGETIGYKK